jgi:phage gpG-like protein
MGSTAARAPRKQVRDRNLLQAIVLRTQNSLSDTAMRNFNSLASAALHFGRLARDLKGAEEAIIRGACHLIAERAKASIRTSANGFNWPKLQPETVKRKSRGDTPLLETGELLGSISYQVDGATGQVDSTSEKAVWHELGTKRIPPRSFLLASAVQELPHIKILTHSVVRSMMLGERLGGAEFGELFHAVKHAWHETKEFATDVLESGNKDERR